MNESIKTAEVTVGDYHALVIKYIGKLEEQLALHATAIQKCKTNVLRSNTAFIALVITFLTFGFGIMINAQQNLAKEVKQLQIERAAIIEKLEKVNSGMIDKLEKENAELRGDWGILLNITYPDHQRLVGYKELWEKYYLNKK